MVIKQSMLQNIVDCRLRKASKKTRDIGNCESISNRIRFAACNRQKIRVI